MKSPTFSLNSRDLKIQLLGTMVLFTLSSFFLSVILTSFYGDLSFWALFSFFESLLIGIIPFFFWDKFVNNMEMHDSNDYLGLSFKGLVIVLFFLGLGLFLGFNLLGYFISSVSFGLCWGLSFFFPLCIIFFRRKIYSENSQYLNNNEKVMGFNPKIYAILGIVISLFLIPFGFFSFQQSFYNYSNIFVSVGGIFISLILIFLVLSPDLTNNFLPFEVRKKSGFIFYSILAVVLSIIFCLLMYYFI